MVKRQSQSLSVRYGETEASAVGSLPILVLAGLSLCLLYVVSGKFCSVQNTPITINRQQIGYCLSQSGCGALSQAINDAMASLRFKIEYTRC